MEEIQSAPKRSHKNSNKTTSACGLQPRDSQPVAGIKNVKCTCVV